MNRMVVGVIGHVDHGKTALVRALTGVDTDRLPEEKARGISIALGFAHFTAADGTGIDLVDMPGHERFVRTMIAGATGIDAVLLVVAANEGIRPQTLEHAEIAALLGIGRAVVAVTKADLVPDGKARETGDAAQALLASLGMSPAGAPVLTSAIQATGIDHLRSALAIAAGASEDRRRDGIAWLPIDRAFAIPGHGPVVTGTLRGAPVSVADELELLPAGTRLRTRALQVHGDAVPQALPGQRVAVNLRGVALSDIARGMALAAPGALAASEWLTLAIRSTAGAPDLANGARLRALVGTQEVDVRLRLLDRDELATGETGYAQLHCAHPLFVPAREHVILRIASPARTVAGGRIIEPLARRRRRNIADVLERLARLSALDPEGLVAAETVHCGAAGTSLRQLALLSGLSAARIQQLLSGLPVVVTARGGLVFPRAELDALESRIPELLAAQSTGLSRNQLVSALPGIRAGLLDEALARLTSARRIAQRGSQLVIPDPEADAARASGEAELAQAIARGLAEAGLTPPNPAAILVDPASRHAVDKLLKQGVLVRAVDRAKGKELIFHRDAIAEARRRLAPLLARDGGLLVTEIAAALEISRKFCMPLLDHLDTIRFTRRQGDRRVPGQMAAQDG